MSTSHRSLVMRTLTSTGNKQAVREWDKNSSTAVQQYSSCGPHSRRPPRCRPVSSCSTSAQSRLHLSRNPAIRRRVVLMLVNHEAPTFPSLPTASSTTVRKVIPYRYSFFLKLRRSGNHGGESISLYSALSCSVESTATITIRCASSSLPIA